MEWTGTYIDENGVYTGVVVASQIVADALSAISSNIGTINAGEIYGVYIEGSEIVQNAGSGHTSIHLNNEGLIVRDSNNNDRLAIVTDEYTFQGANPSSIYFEPNTSEEFILGTFHEGLGEAFLGFVNYHSGYFFNIRNRGGRINIDSDEIYSYGNHIMQSNGPGLQLDGRDHFYIEFYKAGKTNGRSGYFGYPNSSSNDVTFANEMNNGWISFNAVGGGSSNRVVDMRANIGSDNNVSLRLPGLSSYTTSSSPNAYISGAYHLIRSTSARKYKKNIEPLKEEYAFNFFEKAQPVWYQSKANADPDQYGYYGYIADDLAPIEPRLVKFKDYDENGNPYFEPNGEVYEWAEPEGIHYDRISALHHVVMKVKFDEYDSRLEELEFENQTLKERVKLLEEAS
ncbi:tail fiber domain-containing protein [Piscibacillus salipiscarius]|uniref:tail fiber domain-containing protein n=1 Tax=Piscibacillus salipiscarius TaxID=299480 RepID=UPI002436BCAA|nr:tail fiber domain-containing protein [Piscibacillus salipiscarius]